MRTMKIMKRMMGLAAAILALSACSESEDLLSAFHSDPNAVRITAEVGKTSANGFTRSFPLGDAEAQKKFKEGDMISVKADGQDAVTYHFNGTEWQPKESSKFLKWESDEMNFTAYYPATFDGNIDNITLPKEYDEASLAANDFMSYYGLQTNTNGNQLTLTMKRQMARVVVEIDGFNDQYAGAKIDNINSLSICGIKAYKHSDKKFYALIKPCEAQNSATFISLDVADGASKTTTETLTGIPALTAGNSYTYQLKVGKNKISVSGITVKEWTTGEITGGKAETDNTPYITFTAEGEQIFKMITESSSNGPDGENEPYKISGLQYSLNNGDWKEVVENDPVTFGGTTNGTLRLRGKNPKGTAKDSWNYATITFDKQDVKVTCTGDIRTLLDYESYKTVATDQARFIKLFLYCKALTTAPDLPAETLADDCYSFMFEGCTSLKTAPKLPATTLAGYCYFRMFLGCTSLEKAPTLSAKTLDTSCYGFMFSGCTSLKTAPELRATQLFSGCYEGMFLGCNSLVSAPELPATMLAQKCYAYMFQNCANLSSVTILASSDEIKKYYYTCFYWLKDAGTSAASRKLIVLDEAAYNALETNSDYLSAKWKKGATNTTVKYYTPEP